MKSSTQVVALLALLSLGALVVSCKRANLQEVLEEQHSADVPPTADQKLVVVSEINSELETEVVPTTEDEEPPTTRTTTTSQDEEIIAAQQAEPKSQQHQETPKTKRVKVITIAAPDYSIRIEAKPDTPLAIGSTEDMETKEGKLEVSETTSEATVVPVEVAPIKDDAPAKAERKQEVATGGSSAASGEFKVSEKKKDKKEGKKTDSELAGQILGEEEKQEASKENKSQKLNEKKSRKGAAGEERNKRQVKQSKTFGKGPNQKRDKRETKKSGTNKNSKTKRSAEKSRKYNKNKGKSPKK